MAARASFSQLREAVLGDKALSPILRVRQECSRLSQARGVMVHQDKES